MQAAAAPKAAEKPVKEAPAKKEKPVKESPPKKEVEKAENGAKKGRGRPPKREAPAASAPKSGKGEWSVPMIASSGFHTNFLLFTGRGRPPKAAKKAESAEDSAEDS